MEKTKVQMLYEACRVIFSQKELPTFKEILWLKNLIGMISSSLAYIYVCYVCFRICGQLNIEQNAGTFAAIDFGIDEHGSCGSPSSSPNSDKGLICGQGISQITYIHVYECEQFSVSR